MKSIFDAVSQECSRIITQTYSTSFSMATKMLSNSIRQDIYNIYGFVRLADEIVDSFHDYDKEALFIRCPKRGRIISNTCSTCSTIDYYFLENWLRLFF